MSGVIRVLIISERLTTTSQLRFALSAVKHPCSITDASLLADPDQDFCQTAQSVDIVFVAMPFDEALGIQVLAQLRPLSNARIVAVGIPESPQQILRILHSGADDFIDEAGNIPDQVQTELDRVSQNRREAAPAPQGRVIATTGAVGGAGATFTAANLAVLIAQEDRPCGLIDLSGGFGELAMLFGMQPRHTLRELCSNSDSLDLEMLRNSITEHASGVNLIASAPVTSEWEFDSNEATRRVVETSCRLLPNVVLDLNRRVPYSRELLTKCDLIVLLTTLDFRAACSTQRLLESWSERGVSPERVVLVANQCGRKAELEVGMVESLLDRKINVRISDDPLTANLSVNCGNPAVLESPQSTLAKELQRLEQVLAKRIPGLRVQADDPDNEDTRRRQESLSGLLKRVAGSII